MAVTICRTCGLDTEDLEVCPHCGTENPDAGAKVDSKEKLVGYRCVFDDWKTDIDSFRKQEKQICLKCGRHPIPVFEDEQGRYTYDLGEKRYET